MKRRCTWAGCKRRATTVCHYWGADHELCDEHADLVGNDVTDPTEAIDA